MKIKTQFHQLKLKKRIIIPLLGSIGIILVYIFQPMSFGLKQINKNTHDWAVVFVHGSFGSLLGFLNSRDVLNDKISGTVYRNLTRKMRDDEYFYNQQPILKRGLVAIDFERDSQVNNWKKYAVYPIAEGYSQINYLIKGEREKLHFFTFGWSGLMSQNSRLFESIRLYNALDEMLEEMHKKNLFPKIRLLAHSHGGNLALNLAGIKKALSIISGHTSIDSVKNNDELESIKKMIELIKSLPNKETAKTKSEQKIYDYVPVNRSLIIDDLIMYGTPIQTETEHFSTSEIFKNVYNFYSEGDFVQRMDWVTSKKATSGRKFFQVNASKDNNKNSLNQVYQARLMANQPIINDKVSNLPIQDVDNTQDNVENTSFFYDLFYGKNIFAKNPYSPTHKEFWFMSWRNETSVFSSFLNPLPLVILTPLFTNLIKTTQNTGDVNVNIISSPKKLQIFIAEYNSGNVLGKMAIPRNPIDALREKTLQYRPDDTSVKAEFKAIHKHLGK